MALWPASGKQIRTLSESSKPVTAHAGNAATGASPAGNSLASLSPSVLDWHGSMASSVDAWIARDDPLMQRNTVEKAMTGRSVSQFNRTIDGLLAELEPPIRRRYRATCGRLAADVMKQAKQTADRAVCERLIQIGESIESHWLRLAIREELLQAWYRKLNPHRRKFDLQYELFVARALNRTSPKRWTRLFRQSLRVRFWDKRTRSRAEQMNARIRPLLQSTRPMPSSHEHFSPLTDEQLQFIESALDQVADALRRYHSALLEGLEMQQQWLDEGDKPEPDVTADVAE